MDPFTQGLLGSSLSGSFTKKSKLKIAALCGALGGVAPDLDFIIRSQSDPLLTLEYHRHFTHSLAFIPIGGLVVAMAIWFLIYRKNESFKLIYIFTTLGFATHGLLDTCTAYGTRLFWPFNNTRIAWDAISIVDPIYTGILLVCTAIALVRKSPKAIIIGLCLSLLYMSFSYYKSQQAQAVARDLANSRGHKIERIILNPTIGNSILWRSVYQADGRYYVDAIRVGFASEPQIKQGTSVPALDIDKAFATLDDNSTQKQDIRRFQHFANGFIYSHSEQENTIGDLRYATLPYGTTPLWGIEYNTQIPNKHVKWKTLRNSEQLKHNEFWHMLFEGF